MTVTAGVAAIKGTYAGTCALSDLEQHESLVMRLQGAGAPGTVDATVDVSLRRGRATAPPGSPTRPTPSSAAWSAASASGCSGRSRSGWRASSSATSASRWSGERPGALPLAALRAAGGGGGRCGRSAGGLHRPARAGGISSQDDFLKGIAVGAGLVLAGVIVGGLFGRRR